MSQIFLNILDKRDWNNSVDQIQKLTESPIKSTREYPFTLSWSQLQRQYNSSLYERLALSKDKDSVLRLAQEGQTINKPDDIIKNPLTLFSNHCSIIYTKNYGQFVMF